MRAAARVATAESPARVPATEATAAHMSAATARVASASTVLGKGRAGRESENSKGKNHGGKILR